MKKYGIHACGKLSFDKVCREHGCARIHINTPRFGIGLALTPDARFANAKVVDGKVLVGDPPAKWIDVTKPRSR